MQVHQPSQQLNQILEVSPDVLKLIDTQRQNRSNQRWPSWCFLPTEEWNAIFSKQPSNLERRIKSTVLTWAYTKGIYIFPPSLASALPAVGMEDIPLEVLYRLPEWSVYIATPDHQSMTGFFTSLQYDRDTQQASLHLFADSDSLESVSIPMHLETIKDVIDAVPCPELPYCLSRLLYLCSNDVDIKPISGRLPERARPKKTQYGWRLFPADQLSIWVIGERYEQNPAKVQSGQGQWVGKHEERDMKYPPRYIFRLII